MGAKTAMEIDGQMCGQPASADGYGSTGGRLHRAISQLGPRGTARYRPRIGDRKSGAL